MYPKSGSLKTQKEMAEVGKRVRASTKGFGTVKADKYAKEAKSRMDKYVGDRKGL